MDPLAIQYVDAFQAGRDVEVESLARHVQDERAGIELLVYEVDLVGDDPPMVGAVYGADFRRHLHMEDGSEVVLFSDGHAEYQGSNTGVSLYVSPSPANMGRRFLADWFSSFPALTLPEVRFPSEHVDDFFREAKRLGGLRESGCWVIDHDPRHDGVVGGLWKGEVVTWSDGSGVLLDSANRLREVNGAETYVIRTPSEALAVLLSSEPNTAAHPTPKLAAVASAKAVARANLPGADRDQAPAWVFSDGSVLVFEDEGSEYARILLSHAIDNPKG